MKDTLTITLKDGSIKEIPYIYTGWTNYYEFLVSPLPVDEFCFMHIGGIETNCKSPQWAIDVINNLFKENVLYTICGKCGIIIVVDTEEYCLDKNYLKKFSIELSNNNFDYTILNLSFCRKE